MQPLVQSPVVRGKDEPLYLYQVLGVSSNNEVQDWFPLIPMCHDSSKKPKFMFVFIASSFVAVPFLSHQAQESQVAADAASEVLARNNPMVDFKNPPRDFVQKKILHLCLQEQAIKNPDCSHDNYRKFCKLLQNGVIIN